MKENRELHNLPKDAFHKACQEANLAECKRLLKNNPLYLNKAHSINGNTAIYWAVWAGHKEIVTWLLEQNAELFDEDKNHPAYTPLVICVDKEVFILLNKAIKKQAEHFDMQKKCRILIEMVMSLVLQGITSNEVKPHLKKLINFIAKLTHLDKPCLVSLNSLGLMFFNAQAYAEAALCTEQSIQFSNQDDHHGLITHHLNLIQHLVLLKHFEKADTVLEELFRLAEKIKEPHQAHAELLKNLGDTLYHTERYSQAERCYLKADSLADQDNQQFLFDLLVNVISVASVTANPDRAQQTLKKLLAIVKHIKDPQQLNKQFTTLGNCFCYLSLNFEAEQCYQNAVHFTDKNDKSALINCWLNLMGLSFECGDVKKVKECFKKIYSIAKQIKVDQEASIRLEYFANCFYKNSLYLEAEQFFHHAINLAEPDNYDFLISTHLLLINTLFMRNDFAQAKQVMEKLLLPGKSKGENTLIPINELKKLINFKALNVRNTAVRGKKQQKAISINLDNNLNQNEVFTVCMDLPQLIVENYHYKDIIALLNQLGKNLNCLDFNLKISIGEHAGSSPLLLYVKKAIEHNSSALIAAILTNIDIEKIDFFAPSILGDNKEQKTISPLRLLVNHAVIISPDQTEPRPSGSGNFPLANARGSVRSGTSMPLLQVLINQIKTREHFLKDFMNQDNAKTSDGLVDLFLLIDLLAKFSAQDQDCRRIALDIASFQSFIKPDLKKQLQHLKIFLIAEFFLQLNHLEQVCKQDRLNETAVNKLILSLVNKAEELSKEGTANAYDILKKTLGEYQLNYQLNTLYSACILDDSSSIHSKIKLSEMNRKEYSRLIEIAEKFSNISMLKYLLTERHFIRKQGAGIFVNRSLENSISTKLIIEKIEKSGSQNNYNSTIKYLIQNEIKRNSSLNAVHAEGWTPLMSAMISRNDEVIAELMKYDMDLFSSTANGCNAFLIALLLKNQDLFYKLLNKAISKYQFNHDGFYELLANIMNLAMEKNLQNEVINCLFTNVHIDFLIPGEEIQESRINLFKVIPLSYAMLAKLVNDFQQWLSLKGFAEKMKKNKALIPVFKSSHELTQDDFDNECQHLVKIIRNSQWLTATYDNREISLKLQNYMNKPVTLHCFYLLINEMHKQLMEIKEPAICESIIKPVVDTTEEILYDLTTNVSLATGKKQASSNTYSGHILSTANHAYHSSTVSTRQSFFQKNTSKKPKSANKNANQTKINMATNKSYQPIEPTRNYDLPPEFHTGNKISYIEILQAKPLVYKSQQEVIEDKERQKNTRTLLAPLVETELSFLSKIMANFEVHVNALLSLDSLSGKMVNTIMNLSLFDMVYKMNRSLRLQINNSELIKYYSDEMKYLYEMDCYFIHASDKSLALHNTEEQKHLSNIVIFVKNCFMNKGFELLNPVEISRQQFYKQSREIALSSNRPEERIKAVVCLAGLLITMQELLARSKQNEELIAILQHAMSAAFSIIGEQHARLRDESKDVFSGLPNVIKDFLYSCKSYRNLRHIDQENHFDEEQKEAGPIDEEFELLKNKLDTRLIKQLENFCIEFDNSSENSEHDEQLNCYGVF